MDARLITLPVTLALLVAWGSWAAAPAPSAQVGSWLAGDHHIHSRFSVGWDRAVGPPRAIIGGDGVYAIPVNAQMARSFGLSWMVATDHGGPNHSRVNLELAYPELVESRRIVPGLIQFFGMEFDTPGADHSSLIMPHGPDEAARLYDIESRFSRRDPWPLAARRDREPLMLEALEAMQAHPTPPVVIANHPSRSARGPGRYGRYTPAELRDWNDTAPAVAVGMAGAPGHQAAALEPDGSLGSGARGRYARSPTLGGFDPMTAVVGGFWDSMLGEGRRWWITANSDSHENWRDGGGDFWPGEYSKTFVWAERTHDGILEGIRRGRVFVALGDLISELYVTAAEGDRRAEIGGALSVTAGSSVQLTVRFRDPEGPNHNGDDPRVSRVDLIVGNVEGAALDRTTDSNPTTRVVARWSADDLGMDGPYRVVTHVLEDVRVDGYVRVRGTNGTELEPAPDPRGEDPWSDLWFYSNPIFLSIR